MKKILFALVALLGIVACENVTTEPIKESIKLLADKSEIVADGTDAVTFSVKDNDGNDIEEYKILFAETNEELEGNTFKTKYAGEYKFYAQRRNEISNTIIVTAKAKSDDNNGGNSDDPAVKEYVLSVSPSTIVADGVAKAVFTLKEDGKDVSNFDVYNAADDTQLAAREFYTTVAGDYAFYAMCEGEKSNTVEVKATEVVVEEQKPITLTASKNTIKANGVDYAQLTVTEEGGADVTDSATIYVNGGALNGKKFATTTYGTYTLYAVKGEQRSNEITITAEEVTATGTSIVFAEGVTLTSGWYDVNKKSTSQQSQADAMMCWAASSSNIIQWFQDRYVAAGNTLPAGCPNGTSSTYGYELQIMDAFRDNWENLERGNWTDGGVIWYFEGRNVYETNGQESCAYPRSGTGGYFKSQWSSIYANMFKYENGWAWYTGEPYTYATEINNYNWRSTGDPLLKFSGYIVEAFEHGMSSMAVAMSSNFNGAHAVTIWGYEIDNATGYVTKLYIADSDDGSTSTLQPYEVKSESGNAKIMLSGYSNYYPFALYPVSGYNSAN